MRNACRNLIGRPHRNKTIEDRGKNGRIILKFFIGYTERRMDSVVSGWKPAPQRREN
jgi:hypothetical protein